MVNENDPIALLDRYLNQINSLQPLMIRYISLLENFESTTSYLVTNILRHEERIRSNDRRRRRENLHRDTLFVRPPQSEALRISRRNEDNFFHLINEIRNTARNTARNTSNYSNNRSNLLFNIGSLSPVPVIPTEQQINNATEIINFENLTNNRNCPITQQPFSENDRIVQIIPCGHCFNNDALMRWFTTSVRCPVCRADIRDYNPLDSIRNPHNRTNNDSNTNEPIRSENVNIRENQSTVQDPQIEAIFTFSNLITPSSFTNQSQPNENNRQINDNDSDDTTSLV